MTAKIIRPPHFHPALQSNAIPLHDSEIEPARRTASALLDALKQVPAFHGHIKCQHTVQAFKHLEIAFNLVAIAEADLLARKRGIRETRR